MTASRKKVFMAVVLYSLLTVAIGCALALVFTGTGDAAAQAAEAAAPLSEVNEATAGELLALSGLAVLSAAASVLLGLKWGREGEGPATR